MIRRSEHFLRVVLRLLRFAGALGIAALDYASKCSLKGRPSLRSAQAQWLQRASRRLLKVFKVELTVFGPIPEKGLLVCNHLSYLDVLVLGALCPSVFVAKSEVKTWPVLGWFARLGGTIFVHRNRRFQSVESAHEIGAALRTGSLVVLFPEGTSSGGENVLPFKSSLLEPATRHEHTVTTGHIRYSLPDGNVSEEVCYWKDMTFVSHLLNLLAKNAIAATIAFGPARHHRSNRKELAILLHSEVVDLRQEMPV